MNYRDLEIWQLAREIVKEIYDMTLKELPKFEMFESGNQIRRAAVSMKTNIVEGFGRRYYKQDFIKFLIYSSASKDETIDLLETLYDVGFLKNEKKFQSIHEKLELFGKKINRFIQSVENEHKSKK